MSPLKTGLLLCLATCSPLIAVVADPQTEAQMVDLNVVALDNHGQPVVDLRRDEFRITDNGRPETISFFRHRDSALGSATPLGPNEVSNRGASNVPRATVILFDLLNERFSTRGTTAAELAHDLQSLESADYVYLYCITLTGRIFPVHPLPGAETAAPAAGSPPWTRSIKPLLDEALRAVSQVRPVEDLDPTYRVQLTYNALNAIGTQMERVPGRKSLVWLTDGIPIELGPNRSDTGDSVDFTPILRSLSETFDRSNVAIYPVRRVMLGSEDAMGPKGTIGLGSLETLNLFAELTGGRPDAGKDIGAAIRQAIADMRTSYQIGYYPPAGNWDDKFHKLKVNCTRKGVRIQTKTGYYAWKGAPGARSEQAIESALSPSFDAAEIGLRASLTADSKGERAMRLEAHIDARDLVLVHEGEVYQGELRLAFAGYAPGQRPTRGKTVPLDVRFPEKERDRWLRDGIGFAQTVKLPAEVDKVRLIVFDRGSTAIGTVTLPVPETGPKHD